jgi:hypothetical protein
MSQLDWPIECRVAIEDYNFEASRGVCKLAISVIDSFRIAVASSSHQENFWSVTYSVNEKAVAAPTRFQSTGF